MLPACPSKLCEYELESGPRQVVRLANSWVVVLASKYSCKRVHFSLSAGSSVPHAPLGVQRQQVAVSPPLLPTLCESRRPVEPGDASPRGETLTVVALTAFSNPGAVLPSMRLSSFCSRCACSASCRDCALTVSRSSRRRTFSAAVPSPTASARTTADQPHAMPTSTYPGIRISLANCEGGKSKR